MSEEQQNRVFSTSQLDRYVSGGGSVAERHAIEAAALEDPFLAEAIEGLQEARNNAADFSLTRDVTALKRRLEQRKEQRQTIGWWRIAAAVVLILGAGIAAWLLQSKTENTPANQIAVVKKAAPIPSTPILADKEISTSSVVVDSPARSEAIAAPVVEPKKIISPKPRDIDVAPPVSEREAFKADKAGMSQLQDSAPATAAASPKPETVLSGRAAGLITRSAPAAGTTSIVGVVLNDKNKPVADATVRLRNQSIETNTNAEGNFILTAQKDSATIADVQATGYQPLTVRLNMKDPQRNRIQLKPVEMSLMDEVVTGYSARKKAADEEDPFSPDPSMDAKKTSAPNPNVLPANGWLAYNKYLRNNRVIQSMDSAIHGQQFISFLVDAQGKLSAFKVEQSLSPAEDQETIRLIQSGPAWKILKGKKQRALVQLTF